MNHRRDFWRGFCFAIASIAALAAAMVVFNLVWTSGQREHASRDVRGALHQVGSSLFHYDNIYRRLPTAVTFSSDGDAMYSWRFLIDHSMQGGTMAEVKGYHVPWTDAENSLYRAGEFEYSPECFEHKSLLRPCITAIVGPGTAWEPEAPWPTTSSDARSKDISPLDVLDPSTVLLADTAFLTVHWMEPGDFHIDRLAPERTLRDVGLGGLVEGKVHLLFADGETWTVSDDAPCEALRPLCLVDKPEGVHRDSLLGEYRNP